MQLKIPNQRDNWRRLVIERIKIISYGNQAKIVVFAHFVDGEPTTHNPNPTIKLGYDSVKRSLMFSPVRKRKGTTESSPDDSSTVNKTCTMAGNKEEDPDNLVSLLAGFEKDINQQVDESTDFDSINKAEMNMDDNSKV